jgi:FixJ family two-component response regulator
VYAVLLVDIRIPSLGGARLVHEVLRRCLGKAGAIVFTGTCPLKDWGSLLDGWPYVQMPFDMNELLRVIRSAKDGGRGAPMGSA